MPVFTVCVECEHPLRFCTCLEDPILVERMTLRQFEWRVRSRSEELIANEVIEAMYEDRVIAAKEGRE